MSKVYFLILFCFKVKTSNSTEKNSVLFPTCNVAFLIYSVNDLHVDASQGGSSEPNSTLNEDMLQRITKFSRGKARHRYRVGSLGFDSRASQIGHGVVNGLPSLRRFFRTECSGAELRRWARHSLHASA